MWNPWSHLPVHSNFYGASLISNYMYYNGRLQETSPLLIDIWSFVLYSWSTNNDCNDIIDDDI